MSNTQAERVEGPAAAPLIERLRQEAQIHAQEARTANATIAEIYQLCAGATGEPGNWHGAEPVRERLATLQADAELVASATAWWESCCPLAWTSEQHAKNPAVNTRNEVEQRLALAIAARNTTQQQGG